MLELPPPQQVLNDMKAQAGFYYRRDKYLHFICSDAARVLADLLEKKPIDGPRWGDLHARLLKFEGSRGYPIASNISRARLTMEALRWGEVA